MGDKDVIRNVSPFNERILVRGDNAIHQGLQPINHDLRYDFVNNITEANRFEMKNLFWKGYFRNESNKSLIERFKQIT